LGVENDWHGDLFASSQGRVKENGGYYIAGGIMTARARYMVALLWVVSLVVTGAVVAAQTARRDAAAVISGGDIGFRPEGWNGKARTGTWLVRVNGEWVEAQGAFKAAPIVTR
jgi:hypothetical protein